MGSLSQKFRAFLRSILPAIVVRRLVAVRESVHDTVRAPQRLRELEARYLRQLYPSVIAASESEKFRQAEHRVLSQNGEDGLIAYLISRIQPERYTFCEIGIEDGRECNTANLAVNFGWRGLMIEGDPAMAASAARHFAQTCGERVQVVSSFVTQENINSVLAAAGLAGDVDVLSIDIDGIDFWIWKAITQLRPRLVVVEYNSFWGAHRAVTVPYERDFNRFQKHPSGYYCGASLKAFEKLAAEKGYALVDCESTGLNAFFVRADLAQKAGLPALTSEQAFRPFAERKMTEPLEVCLARIEHLPLVEV